MGGLYAFADEILNQGRGEDPDIFSSNSNALSEKDKVRIAMGIETPTKVRDEIGLTPNVHSLRRGVAFPFSHSFTIIETPASGKPVIAEVLRSPEPSNILPFRGNCPHLVFA